MNYSEITDYIKSLADISVERNGIRPDMYPEHNVKKGLRDLDGNGVIAGLTEISSIKSKELLPDGTSVSCDGELRYRGIDLRELVRGFVSEGRSGYEEAVYLLLFSKLPTKSELERFQAQLSSYRSLPPSFVRI